MLCSSGITDYLVLSLLVLFADTEYMVDVQGCLMVLTQQGPCTVGPVQSEGSMVVLNFIWRWPFCLLVGGATGA